ncbi:MAG TPA: mycothiol synthase [Pseudonocardiaceae bacterium]|nr:mycothiol synthase [Pseudonocardiaceae bacterium]
MAVVVQQTPQELSAPILTWTARPSEAETADVLALLAAAAGADGVYPISEAAELRLRHRAPPDAGPPSPAGHLLVRDPAGSLVGYGGLDERVERPTAEFAVHPGSRRRGIGAAMLAALLARVPGPLWIWAHGEHPAALRLAERAGLDRRRELLQLRRGLADPVAPRPLPDGLRLRPFVPGQDEPAVVRVNNRAFAWHPEQGRWDVGELAVRQAQPWFDPAGFLLAVDGEDRLRGFHWTKVHPEGCGEVYVIGIEPSAQGIGLGGALIVAGLAYLRDRGLAEVLLYVEADNAAALRTYRKLGFRPHHTDVEFLRSAVPSAG